jgi:hypothetical protein
LPEDGCSCGRKEPDGRPALETRHHPLCMHLVADRLLQQAVQRTPSRWMPPTVPPVEPASSQPQRLTFHAASTDQTGCRGQSAMLRTSKACGITQVLEGLTALETLDLGYQSTLRYPTGYPSAVATSA